MRVVRGTYERVQEHGPVAGGKQALADGYKESLRTVGRHFDYGQKPYTADWDVLVLLDACRFDLFEEYAPNHPIYERLESVDSVYSCASSSTEWVSKAYGREFDEEVADTHLVSGNGWESRRLDLDRFGGVTPIWEHWDSELGTTRPGDVTDAAIHAGRRTDCGRLIVHYMQPHAPFLHCAGKYNSINEHAGQGQSQNVWKGLKKGEHDLDEVWEGYGQNLLTVLDDVERLIDNISGSVVISADHGNLVGEFGLYGHPAGLPIPTVKRVPWVRVEASDTETYVPEDPIEPEVRGDDVDDHLRALGYKV